MASITIRNLDDTVKAKLRIAAATHGCSMEEEARQILRRTLMTQSNPGQLGTRISQHFAGLTGIDLPIPERSAPRPAPGFTDPDE
ncbi:MAG: plasmid stabilization protein [Xanthomonadales bacterium]|nr:plasmid stabilization protein [Xanthomonadales bacterium]